MPDLPVGRGIRPTVGWLLGPELIANLRAIVRRKGRRGDPRTWMAPDRHEAHDEYTEQRDGRLRRQRVRGTNLEFQLWDVFTIAPAVAHRG